MMGFGIWDLGFGIREDEKFALLGQVLWYNIRRKAFLRLQ